MEANPYQSPVANLDAVDRWTLNQKQLWDIAIYQKFLMGAQLVLFSVSLFIIFYTQFFVGMMNQSIQLYGFWFWTTMVIFAVSLLLVVVNVTALSNKCWHLNAAVATLLGMFIPAVNLIVLLGVNALVTRKLRAHSIQVGLFGADMDDIRNQQKDAEEPLSQETAIQIAIPVEK
ncbi:MAG: hypothetical protein VX738_06375 [Planctomycetota bacterium]|nr:hypothetical protein [Planctomycetota bacterium]